MQKQALHNLEARGIIVTVAGTLIKHRTEGDIMALLRYAVLIKGRLGVLLTIGKEHGQITKIVKMMIDGVDAERAHAGGDHRAVKGQIGQQANAMIIKPFHRSHNGTQNGTGKLGEKIQQLMQAMEESQ